jgi:16S rRNA (guanine527-N7)-methyltransferase
MNNFIKIVDGKISLASKNSLKNGILYLKGGDLTSELKIFKTAKTININSYFSDPFFETKKIVYLPMPYVGKDTHLVD